MRGIYTPVTDIRRKVFTEVARMSYESNEMADYAKEIRDLPFKIMPGEDSSLRSSIFLERAIVSGTNPSGYGPFSAPGYRERFRYRRPGAQRNC